MKCAVIADIHANLEALQADSKEQDSTQYADRHKNTDYEHQNELNRELGRGPTPPTRSEVLSRAAVF